MRIKLAPASCGCELPRRRDRPPVASERLRKVDEPRTQGACVALALESVDLPKSACCDWCKALAGGVAGLVPKSRRPRASIDMTTPSECFATLSEAA